MLMNTFCVYDKANCSKQAEISSVAEVTKIVPNFTSRSVRYDICGIQVFSKWIRYET